MRLRPIFMSTMTSLLGMLPLLLNPGPGSVIYRGLAAAIVGAKAKPKEGVTRVAVILAAIVMSGVYLIPHSKQGSELDYTKLEEGVDPKAAIGTGDD